MTRTTLTWLRGCWAHLVWVCNPSPEVVDELVIDGLPIACGLELK
jgi:hypothetical protein